MPTSSPVVLITGTSSGIGRATALRLAEDGFTVFAGVRKEADGQELRAVSPRLTPVMIDVTNQGQITDVAEHIAETAGRLDGLVNNAGIAVTGPLEHLSLETLRWQYEVDVFGQIAVIQAMLPLLREARGRVVTIGSTGGWLTMPFAAPLTSSKHAIRALSDSLRMELKPWGIEVVLIEPGAIRTPGVDKVAAEVAPILEALGATGRRHYGDAYRTMTTRAVARERAGTDPSVVAEAVRRALTARRPRTRYPVGKDSRLPIILARLLPQRTLDTLRLRALGLSAKGAMT